VKVLLAGATGAVGLPLVSLLHAAGHHVTGLVRSAAGATRLRELGATSRRADVLDREGLLRAVRGETYDAVLHELTALKKAPLRVADMAATNELRTRGTAHLLEVAHEVGAQRFLTQSIVLGYGFADHGPAPLTEAAPFGQPEGSRVDPVLLALAAAEQQVFRDPDVAGVALRYGLFYGRDLPTVERMLRRRSLPVTASGGTLALVHHDDAAAATVAALERGRADTAYNVADDTPVSWRGYVTAAAAATGAPRPLVVPGALLRAVAPYAGRLATEVSMVVSSARARAELGWQPRHPSCAAGLRASAAGEGLP
jgi:nucleoside-diphosphate-sugar epimerase